MGQRNVFPLPLLLYACRRGNATRPLPWLDYCSVRGWGGALGRFPPCVRLAVLFLNYADRIFLQVRCSRWPMSK